MIDNQNGILKGQFTITHTNCYQDIIWILINNGYSVKIRPISSYNDIAENLEINIYDEKNVDR